MISLNLEKNILKVGVYHRFKSLFFILLSKFYRKNNEKSISNRIYRRFIISKLL